MSNIEIFLWGLMGGVGAEMVGVFAIRRQNPAGFPYWIRSLKYYIIASIMILIGAALALAYYRSGFSLNPILAIQIGASAPLILRKASDTVIEPKSPSESDSID